MDTTERLPFLGAPPAREPVRVTEHMALRGARMILSQPDGFHYDLRAIAAPIWRQDKGKFYVVCLAEADYYRWVEAGGGQVPADLVRSYPMYLMWRE